MAALPVRGLRTDAEGDGSSTSWPRHSTPR